MPRFSGLIFMIRLLLIRHAATDVSDRQVFLGSTDREASPSGLEQLARLPALLGSYGPAAWYCSTMRRAAQTAEELQRKGAIAGQVSFDGRLREIDFGRWEQKTFTEIQASDPALIPAWSMYDDFIFPEGEAVAGFTGRVAEMLDGFRSSEKREIAVITHGGVIRTMVCLALGIDARNYLLFSVHPASLTILDLYPEGGVLSGLNL